MKGNFCQRKKIFWMIADVFDVTTNKRTKFLSLCVSRHRQSMLYCMRTLARDRCGYGL